jgi:vancomycin resistance protein VanW
MFHSSSISRVAREDIFARLTAERMTERVPFSVRFPRLKPVILWTRQTGTSVRIALNRQIARMKSAELLPHRFYKHASLLLRKLGASDMKLQHGKIKNLEIAIASIDGVIIQPGEIFSLWSLVGRPTPKKGYVDGMLLSRGKVIEGLGGGLCQLANLLHWMFLHGPFEIVERYHHSLDVFPDSGRTVPFGSGATILYNFVDLKAKNVSTSSIQIHLWMTKDKLQGELRTSNPHLEGYRIKETDHCFVSWNEQWYRYNRLWRVSRLRNRRLVSELVVTNLAPVLYEIDEMKMRNEGYTMLKL